MAPELFFFEGRWTTVLQQRFPMDGILGWKELRPQPGVGLAWQTVAGLFLACSGGDGL